jgi:YHS domain-containing protein
MATDLVCNMDVEKEGARFFSEYAADTYYFCSPECKRKFDDHPDNYIRNNAKTELGI